MPSRILRKLDRQVQVRLPGFLRERVAALDDPRSIGEALVGAQLGNYWKYRVGEWCIIAHIQDDRIIVRVLRVGNRREIDREVELGERGRLAGAGSGAASVP